MPPASKPIRALLLLLLTYVGFISLGLPDGMLGVAWPSMRAQFDLPLDAVSAVLVVFIAGYLISTLSSGWLLARMNVGMLLALSGAATAVGLIGYATAPAWAVIVALSFISGLGAGAIDTGLNTYAAMNYSARTMNWLHACYGLGAASGPVLLTSILASGAPWQRGYFWVGIGEVVLVACFLATLSWWPKASGTAHAEQTQETAATQPPATLWSTLRLRTVWLGIATFFIYTGTEAAVGTWAYTFLTGHHGVAPDRAGNWTAAYWGSLTVGRIAAGLIAGKFTPRALILGGAWIIVMGAVLIVSGLGATLTIVGIMFIGFGCAPIFPSLISTTPNRVPLQHTANAVGYQIAAATLGIALVPSFVGFLGRVQGLQVIPVAWFVAAAALLVLLMMLLRFSPNPSLIETRTASGTPSTP
ncbi:fucose permease [Roseimicrobium gellanilyticum]|uniref:Fucose permease n=1 Tax=Roseimicrobium gellanilyticum TaxID=748857 RepID=A0A366HTS0_9BACT|nr:MFS transporter [Roseimicrobium gellanilyticum]RBP46314.1 fucose permease [Roseimicrobium gellanilyticum]